MNDRLQQLALFVRTVETRSFSRAAREFGLTQPSASRSIAALEKRLGVKLIARTTRQISATDAGQKLLERAREALAAIEDAENAARGANRLSGVLRVALSTTYGARRIAPLLPAFVDRHPGLKMDLMMSDRYENLIAEGAELAIRIGERPDFELCCAQAREYEASLHRRPVLSRAAGRAAKPRRPRGARSNRRRSRGAWRTELGSAAKGPHRDRAGRASSARALGGWRRSLRRGRPRHSGRLNLDVRRGACVWRPLRSADGLRARSDDRLCRVSRRPATLTEGAHLRQLS